MPLNWYALHSHPNREKAVFQELLSRRLEAFYPSLTVKPVNPRSRKERPYFPGYLFVRVDLEETGLSTLQWMPHVIRLVSHGGEPSPVPDTLIHALQRRMDQLAAHPETATLPAVKPGDKVVIGEGPFEGYPAIFDARLPGTQRVRVLLKLLSGVLVKVDLDGEDIRPERKKK
jgi:transcriptional antiterminator RfaH